VPLPDLSQVKLNGVTLLIGSAGALAFLALQLPTPFLSGPMVALAISILCGRPAVLHGGLRDLGLMIGGMTMGLGLVPEMLSGFSRFPASLVMLAIVVCGTMAASYWFLKKFGGWDAQTAFFASVPGALSVVMATAADSKADQMRVVVVQSMRLFVLFALAPSILAFDGQSALRLPLPAQIAPLWLIGLLGAAALVCGIGLRRVHMAAPFLMAGLLVAGTARLGGFVDVAMPDWLGKAGFLLVGVFIGTRFNGITPATLKPLFGLALASVALSFLLTLLAAAVAMHLIPGVSFSQAVIAYAPGALEGMILLGAAMGLEPIFVGLHHFVRFLGIAALLPAVSALFLRGQRR
jgi:uncharacterized protein